MPSFTRAGSTYFHAPVDHIDDSTPFLGVASSQLGRSLQDVFTVDTKGKTNIVGQGLDQIAVGREIERRDLPVARLIFGS